MMCDKLQWRRSFVSSIVTKLVKSCRFEVMPTSVVVGPIDAVIDVCVVKRSSTTVGGIVEAMVVKSVAESLIVLLE